MAGIAYNYHTHTVFLSLVNSHSHRLVADNLSHAVVTVYDCGGGRLFNYFKVCNGVLNTVFDSVKIDGLKTVYTVRLDTSFVRLQKYVCADFGVFSGNSVAHKRINYEICDCFPVNYIVFCHWLFLR